MLGAGRVAAMPPVTPAYVIRAAVPQALAHGTQKAWPIAFSEDAAIQGMADGGLWLPNPQGGLIYARYVRHVVHHNGTWTWIGSVDSVHGPQSVTLTFGQGGVVFGSIPQASGLPLEISTVKGETRIIATDAKSPALQMAQLRRHLTLDYVLPTARPATGRAAEQARADQPLPAPATASDPATIDLLVAYTPGFVSAYGSASAALARIQFLVDWANQAYVNSGIHQQLRLVHTVEVDYTDGNPAVTALADLASGQAGAAGAGLVRIPALRKKYGADEVVLVRPSDNARGNGTGYLNGYGQTPLLPQFAYAVDCDVAVAAFPGAIDCPPLDFAHELGHNMGDAHDRATSDGTSDGADPAGGAYPYSYGYKNAAEGIATIMAYADPGETPLQVFSNPDIAFCKNYPCGVPDSSPDSADDAHSMNNTASIIAAFEPTTVAPSGALVGHIHNDLSGDGKSDLLWYNATTHQLSAWQMNGPVLSAWQVLPVPAGYTPIATGDFNGDGLVDILWSDAGGNVYLWVDEGDGTFTSDFVAAAQPGAKIVATVDIDGDGDTDLVWYDAATGGVDYWFMDGASVRATRAFYAAPGLTLVATGDFNGDDYGDLIWETPAGEMYMWLSAADGSFTYHDLGAFPAGWVAAGTGDVNADGRTDLYWYDPTTGEMTYWLMNGAAVAAWQPFQTDAGLTPVATGLFDGRDAGLTWAAPWGAMYMWWFAPAHPTTLQFAPLANYPAGWVPIP